jgi:hypothetical protein
LIVAGTFKRIDGQEPLNYNCPNLVFIGPNTESIKKTALVNITINKSLDVLNSVRLTHSPSGHSHEIVKNAAGR